MGMSNDTASLTTFLTVLLTLLCSVGLAHAQDVLPDDAPKLESSRTLQSQVFAKGYLWVNFMPGHAPGKHACVVGKPCHAVMVNLRGMALADVVVAKVDRYKQTPSIYYKGSARWGHVREGVVSMQMCPKLARELGYDRQILYSLGGDLFTSTRDGEKVPASIVPNAQGRSFGKDATVLCPPNLEWYASAQNTPKPEREAADARCGANQTHVQVPGATEPACYDDCKGGGACEAGFECRSYNSGDIELCVPNELGKKKNKTFMSSSRLERATVGKGWFGAIWDISSPFGKNDCAPGKPCHAVFVSLEKGGAARVRVSHTKRYKKTPRSQFIASGTWSSPEDGRLVVSVCPELGAVLGANTFSIAGLSKQNRLLIGIDPENMAVLEPAKDSLVAKVTGDATRDVCAKPVKRKEASKKWMKKKLVGKGDFWIEYDPSRPTGDNACVEGGPCQTVVVNLSKKGKARIKVAQVQRHGIEGGTVYHAKATWTFEEPWLIKMKMCPEFEKVVGHSARYVFGLDDELHTALTAKHQAPLYATNKKSQATIDSWSTKGLCGLKDEIVKSKEQIAREKRVKKSRLARKLVGKGYFGAVALGRRAGTQKNCTFGRPCYMYTILLEPDGTARANVFGSDRHGDTSVTTMLDGTILPNTFIVRSTASGTWDVRKDGSIQLDLCTDAKGSVLWNLSIKNTKSGPRLYNGAGSHSRLERSDQETARGVMARGRSRCK